MIAVSVVVRLLAFGVVVKMIVCVCDFVPFRYLFVSLFVYTVEGQTEIYVCANHQSTYIMIT